MKVNVFVKKSGFTLVELLVTIAIIATLSALGFVAGGKVIDQGKKTKNLDLATRLKLAIEDYHDDYGRLPAHKIGVSLPDKYWTSGGDFLRELTGETWMTNIANHKRENYFPYKACEVRSDHLGGGSSRSYDGIEFFNGNGDPLRLYNMWGGTFVVFHDHDYDGIVDTKAWNNLPGVDSKKRALVHIADYGRDRQNSYAPGSNLPKDETRTW